jgi:multidrug resistance efflux pump
MPIIKKRSRADATSSELSSVTNGSHRRPAGTFRLHLALTTALLLAAATSSVPTGGKGKGGGDTATLPATVVPNVTATNGAAANGASSNGASSGGTRHTLGRRMAWALAAALLAAAVAAAVLTLGALTAPPSFTGQVQSAATVALNFPTVGRLSSVAVEAGQRVAKGEVLATQDASVADATLAADQAVVDAQQAQLSAMQAPFLSSALSSELALEVSQAEVAMHNAQTAVADATSVAGQNVQVAQNALDTTQQQLTGDQTNFQSACPNGVPDPSTLSSSDQITLYLNCQNLQGQMQKDSDALAAAQTALPQAQALAQQLRDVAGSALLNAELALSIAQSQPGVQAAPATPAQVAAVQVSLAQAKAKVATDQQSVDQLQLLSPVNGIVTSVGGTTGELVDQTGVRVFSGVPSPATTPQGFSILPQSTSSGSQASSVASVPMFTVEDTGTREIIAQVTESSIVALRRGEKVTITFNALGITEKGRMMRVIPAPLQGVTPPTYDVIFKVAQ